MVRLIQTIVIALLVAGLAASGATTAHERMGGAPGAAKHSAHSVIESHHHDVAGADDEHCPHAAVSETGDVDHGSLDGCKTCCVVCIVYGVIPEPPFSIPGSAHRDAVYERCKTLTGVIASADPRIPKL